MKFITLDIETIPDQNLPESCTPVFDPSDLKMGNLKDPDKIEAKIAEEKVKFKTSITKTMSLDPAMAQLCTFCGIVFDTESGEEIEKVSVQITKAYNGDDLEAVTEGWALIQRMYGERTPLVTFNGISFDLQIMFYRAIRQDVTVQPDMFKRLTQKYSNFFHYDLMQILAGWDRQRWHKLDFYLKAFKMNKDKEGMDGSQVYPAWQAGEYDKIQEYCESDVRSTAELFGRVLPWIQIEREG